MRSVLSVATFVGLFSQLVLAQDLLDARSVRQCYQCSGTACSRTTLQNVTVTCGDPLDACVTVFDEYNPVVRGCFLEIPDQYRSKCDRGSIACDKCAGSLCNKYARADVMCLQCDSSKDPGCLYSPSRMQPKRCPLTPTPNSYCFIRYSQYATVFGCTSSLKDQRSCYNDENCLLCLPDGRGVCNAVEFPTGRRQCLVCSEKGCRQGGSLSAYCTKADDHCVALKMNGEVVRGCLSSLNATQSDFCMNNLTMCSKCNVNNCNIEFDDDSSNGGNGGESGGNGGNGGESGGNGGDGGGNGENGGDGGENGGNGGNGGDNGGNGGNGGDNGGNGENGGGGGASTIYTSFFMLCFALATFCFLK